MDGYALLESLCGAHSVKRVAAETGIPRTTLRRLRTAGCLPADAARAADLTAKLQAFAARAGLLNAPSPGPAAPAAIPAPASAVPLPSSMAERLQEAEAVRKIADARGAQLRTQAEARRQLIEDGALIPTDVFVGVATDVAGELRRMVDRQRRRVEAIAPTAGAAVEEEWLATAPRIEALLRRIEPAGAEA